jgi:hypothetical protein
VREPIDAKGTLREHPAPDAPVDNTVSLGRNDVKGILGLSWGPDKYPIGLMSRLRTPFGPPETTALATVPAAKDFSLAFPSFLLSYSLGLWPSSTGVPISPIAALQAGYRLRLRASPVGRPSVPSTR